MNATAHPPTSFDTYHVLGVPISAVNLQFASDLLHSWAADDVPRFVFIRDVHGVMQALDDPILLQLHKEAAMVTPDGMPLVWLGKIAGKNVSRTCGPDLMDKVMADSAKTGMKHFLYGGVAGVAQNLERRFREMYPSVDIVGARTPPFRPLTEDELVEISREIQQCEADIVWIGISTPRQELLMAELSKRITGTLIGVGAAFDFHTGRVSRAPRWMRSSGFEWAWRLGAEPKRLWRRYLIKAPRFIALVISEKLRKPL